MHSGLSQRPSLPLYILFCLFIAGRTPFAAPIKKARISTGNKRNKNSRLLYWQTAISYYIPCCQIYVKYLYITINSSPFCSLPGFLSFSPLTLATIHYCSALVTHGFVYLRWILFWYWPPACFALRAANSFSRNIFRGSTAFSTNPNLTII